MLILQVGRSLASPLPGIHDGQTDRARRRLARCGTMDLWRARNTVAADVDPVVGSTDPAGSTKPCDLDDCSCTGRNIGKFTSPAALLAIAEAGQISGYDIAERLRSMPLGGESGPDMGGVYRTLRRMERYNLVTSVWDTEGGGPARRLYTLTNLGSRCLERWIGTLQGHRDAVQHFLNEYERFCLDQPQEPS
jgi:PadR family transcriptional regulator PadR